MLPPINYKIHPKMAEILQQKRLRRQILQKAREKQEEQRVVLKEGRKQYIEENKRQISKKLQQIHERKVIKRNAIRQEQKERSLRIAMKKAERLMLLIPERRQLVQMLKNSYIQNFKINDQLKHEKIQKIIEQRITKVQQEIKLDQKIRENNIIDTNEGICVICLTSQAHIYMTECHHLISCKDCEFILRMQKKCPLCRRISNYEDLKTIKRPRKQSVKK